MITSTRAQVMLILAVLVTACNLGCGQSRGGYNLAPVTGTVKLDGKPVEKVTVIFSPMASESVGNPGPSSIGVTDQTGKYELKSMRTEPGAVVGKHRVSITGIVYDGETVVKPEFIPSQYNTSSSLTAEVTDKGSNTLEFQLTSGNKAP